VDTYTQIHTSEPVECIGLSPGGNIGISGSEYGKLRVWDATNGTIRRDLIGHVGDIYVAKILPSSQVAMSGSADMQIKIWRLSDGLCAASLKGHSGGVTSLSFIDRGRNFISSSRDGTMRLWDCASQSEITTLSKNGSAYTDCSVDINTALSSNDQNALDNRDFSTEGKIALCSSLNGSIKAIDIRSRTLIFNDIFKKGLLCCGLYNGYNALAGSVEGHLLHYDLRKINSNKQVDDYSIFKRNHAAVNSIAYHGEQHIWCATGDGSCYLWNYANHDVLCDLTGPDYSKLNDVAVHNRTVYTVAKDGAIRRYNLV
jgi:proteasomal ATPase-associated factor 1